jgi:hypothetical protein
MSTELLEATEMSVVKLNVTDQAIAEMKSEYMSLTVTGIEDRAGLKKVYDSRQIVKRTRVGVEKHSKELKEKALAWQRKVNDETKRVVGELESIENYLQSIEDDIQAEKDRICQEEEDRENERIQNRMDQLSELNARVEYSTVKQMDDAAFAVLLESAKVAYQRELEEEKERARIAQLEADKLKAEREELDRLRKESELIRKQQEEREAAIRLEQQKLEEERNRIERQRQEEEAAKQRAIELEQVRKDAEEKAKRDAFVEASRIEREKQEQAERERIELERQEALRPDKEKLQLFSDSLGQIKMPDVSETSKPIVDEIQVLLSKIQQHITKRIKSI